MKFNGQGEASMLVDLPSGAPASVDSPGEALKKNVAAVARPALMSPVDFGFENYFCISMSSGSREGSGAPLVFRRGRGHATNETWNADSLLARRRRHKSREY